MEVTFYITAAVALAASLMVVLGANAVHALLYLVVSLLAIALIFFLLGATFAAGLQVIVYAGAILVLFVFVIMMLNQGRSTEKRERQWLDAVAWRGPFVLGAILLIELLYALTGTAITRDPANAAVSPAEVGVALFGPYLLAVELASLLLLAGLIGAYRIGRSHDGGPI